MRSNLRKFVDESNHYLENTYRSVKRRKDARKRLREMNGGYAGRDKEYREVYLPFWKKYGVRPKKMWFRLYAKEAQPFDPRYIPDDLWYGKILPYFSNMDFRRPYEDKCFHNILFPELKTPTTVIRRMAHVFYDDQYQIIAEKDALSGILEAGEVIIKPSVDSGTGRLIQFFDSSTESLEDLQQKLLMVGDNYIVQSIVKQHPEMNRLFSGSLNTIRVITFLFENQVYVLSVICRMGMGKSRVDNVSAGGLQIGVNLDGTFMDYASDKHRNKHAQHPDTKTVFAGFKIPSFEKIIEQAKRQQARLPHFKIVGWDFAVDHSGDPVFIEYNVCPGSNQMTCGPTFGDLTEAVLEDVFINKSLRESQN